MVQLLVWVIVGLLALSFFGVSLKSLVNSPTNKENIAFISQLLHQGWSTVGMWLHTLIDPIVGLLHVHIPF